MKKTNYFIVAAEPSADKHGALLMKEILKLQSNTKFTGVGGDEMKDLGQTQYFHCNQMAVMGFSEIVKHVLFFKKAKSKLLNTISETQPEKVILIDYPGLNLRLAKDIKNTHNIPIIYYISPQLWAWKENRIRTIKKYVDKMLVILPFEKEWYHNRGYEVEFVGHPLLDQWKPQGKNTLIKKLSLNEDQPILTLFPGSRKQEIYRHLQLMLDVAKLVKKEIKPIQVVLGLARGFNVSELIKEFDLNNVKIETENPSLALEVADTAIVASGTSTLEATIYETPTIIVYKMSKISWLISKIFVKVRFAGLANIISGKETFPEFLQNKATAKRISKQAIKMLNDDKYKNNIILDVKNTKTALGGAGASKRTAKIIVDYEN